MKITHNSSKVVGRCHECRKDDHGHVFEIELAVMTVRLCRKCAEVLFFKIINARNATANEHDSR